MSKSFKAWMIANMSVVFAIATMLNILLAAALQGAVGFKGALVGFGLLGVVVFGMMDVPSMVSTVILLVCHAAIVIRGLYVSVTQSFHSYLFVLVVVAAVSILFAIHIARLASQHFYELVSLRMLYRTSNADMFETKWKYVFNRFAAASGGALIIMLELIFLVYPECILMSMFY